MDKKMINKQLAMSVPTIINRELREEKEAQRMRTSGLVLKNGSQLKGKNLYTIVQKLELSSGEADLYTCRTSAGNTYVAKIYKRDNPLKKGVAEAIQGIRSPSVASVYDIFTWNDRTVVILPYYKNGSLAGKKYTLQELKQYIIPDINEGLKAIHDARLLHKDLKPANIMLRDDGKSVAIIDFGISSLLEDGNTVLLTRTGMTPVYSAPEIFNGLALVEADYYSFGITLYELFCGKTPYTGLSDAEIAKFTSIQRIPLPKDMPAELQQLIAALTYPDITNRNRKENPNRRWTYEEVKKWLKGEYLPSPGGFDTSEMEPLVFHGKTYRKCRELLEDMGLYWSEGKKILFHGTLAGHVKHTNPDLCEYCNEAMQKASANNGKDDIVYFEFLYRAAPQMKVIYWKERKFESLPVLGRSILESLWQNNDSQYRLYDSLFSEKVVSTYVSVRAAENETLMKAVDNLETLWLVLKKDKKDIRLAYYIMGYLLSNQIILRIEDEEIHTVNELAEFLTNRLKISVKSLIDTTHKFVDYDGNLDVQVEAWLTALGKQNELDRWREIMLGGGENA